jgi:hypothetical protein
VTQKFVFEGKPYEFPDDATMEEIQSYIDGQSAPKASQGSLDMTQKSLAAIEQAQLAGSNPGQIAFMQGGLQGYGDEIAGGITSAITGNPYEQERDYFRSRIGAAEAEAPTGAKLAGNLATGLPAAALTGGSSLWAQLGLGGLFTGVNAYGETKENDAQAVQDVAVGTGLGMLGGGFGYGAGKVLEKFVPKGLAFGAIKEAVAGKFQPLLDQMKKLGASAAETDEVVREFLRQQAAKNSLAATAAQPAARARLADVNQQVVQSIDDLISPENVAAFTRRTQGETAQSVRPNYEITKTQPAGAVPDEIASLPAYDEALAAAQSLAEFEKRAFDPANLTVKDLDVMQRFLRLSKEKSFQGNALETMKGSTYGNTREAVNELAKSVSPELAEAQTKVAIQKSVDEATELGKSALNGNKEAIEVAEEFAALGPEAQEGYRAAFASRLRAQLAATKGAKGTKANTSSVLDKPGVVEKMKALGFPAEEIDAILERGAGARGVLDALIGGSQTARLTAAAKASESPLGKITGTDLTAGALVHPGAVVALPAAKSAATAQEQKVAKMIIDALTSQDPALLQAILKRAPQSTTTPILRMLGIAGGGAAASQIGQAR